MILFSINANLLTHYHYTEAYLCHFYNHYVNFTEIDHFSDVIVLPKL